jgi:hypothetical protein
MTTTVHSPNIPFVEACAAIPAVWDNVAHERDRLRKSGAQGDGGTGGGPASDGGQKNG